VRLNTIIISPPLKRRIALGVFAAMIVGASIARLIANQGVASIIQFVGIMGFLIIGGMFRYRPPIELSFQVGNSEIHVVKFEYRPAIIEGKVFIDGAPIVKSDSFWWEKRKENFKFQVGESEIHEVLIQRVRPLLAGILQSVVFNIYVDGQHLTQNQVNFVYGRN